MKFYGREEELKELRLIRETSFESARFTVVTGRRRVGKTELLEKALNDGVSQYLYFLVTERAEKDLCSILQEEAQKVISQPILGTVERFSQLFEIVMAYSAHTPMTLVIDEFQDFDSFLGVSLEHYFRTKLLEGDSYTRAANWWDRKGENEIDLVCENEFSGKVDFFEVKLDAKRYDEALLKGKVEAFLRKHPDKRRRDSRIGLLSVADM